MYKFIKKPITLFPFLSEFMEYIKEVITFLNYLGIMCCSQLYKTNNTLSEHYKEEKRERETNIIILQ